MRKEEKLYKLNEKDFKRLIGVKRETYELMLEEYRKHKEEKKKNFGIGGAKPKLTEASQVLLMLEYYREYRTMAHIGFDYEISESSASRIINEVESVLIKSGKFSLPSKRALYGDDIELGFVVIDVTEMPIQRPKKNKNEAIQVKRKDIQ